MANTKPTCRAADRARLGPQRSCSKKISPLAMRFQRLRHDADVGNTRLLDRVHNRGECAEGDVFVGAEINRLMGRVRAEERRVGKEGGSRGSQTRSKKK